MTLEDQLREEVANHAAQAKQQASRLQGEILDLEIKTVLQKTELDKANLASQRAANFPIKIGIDYQCPRCWIFEEKRSGLVPRPSPPRRDIFECSDCGSSVIVDR